MTTSEIYVQSIKPLPADERLLIARLILDDLVPNTFPSEAADVLAEGERAAPEQIGFERLKHILPQIERITFTDQELASVVLDRPHP